MPLASDSRAGAGHQQKEAEKAAKSKLLLLGELDASDELDLALQYQYKALEEVLGLGQEREIHSNLQAKCSEASQQHADVISGLLYGILTAQQASTKLLGYMTSVTRDSFATCTGILQRLASEKWTKLLPAVKGQFLWLVRALVGLAVADAEHVCFCLLRQLTAGDMQQATLWLASQMLDIFRKNSAWFHGLPSLFTVALYSFLRLLSDHAASKSPAVAELANLEAEFCLGILRERFQDCMVIGRDLVRALQDVASVPGFEQLWRDLLCNPQSFGAPSFVNLGQLYATRTPSRYLASRVSPEMEGQIRFMLTHVRMGSQRRYQTWFAEKFLQSPERESLISDLVRFICCVVHPTNQILQSDVVPRWAVIGWLLKSCRTCHAEANAKLALFYDWLFFAPKVDNIMNIEPAVLCMVHSIPKYADVTNSLLEFVLLLMEHYDTQRRQQVHDGVQASMQILVGKGVIQSLDPLALSPQVAVGLREKVKALFPAFLKAAAPADAARLNSLPPSPAMDPQPVAGAEPFLSAGQAAAAAVTSSSMTSTAPARGVEQKAEELASHRTLPEEEEIVEDDDVAQSDRTGHETSQSVSSVAVAHQELEEGEKEAVGKQGKDLMEGAGKRKRAEPAEESGQGFERAVEELRGSLERRDESAVAALMGFFERWLQKLSPRAKRKKTDEEGSRGDGVVLGALYGQEGEDGEGAVSPALVAERVMAACASSGMPFFSAVKERDGVEKSVGAQLVESILCLAAGHGGVFAELLVCWQRRGKDVSASLLCFASDVAQKEEEGGGSQEAKAAAAAGETEVEDKTEAFEEIVEDDDYIEDDDDDVVVVKVSKDDKPQLNASTKIFSPEKRRHAGGGSHGAKQQGQISGQAAFGFYQQILADLARDGSDPAVLGGNDEKYLSGSMLSGANGRSESEGSMDQQASRLFLADLQTCLCWSPRMLARNARTIFKFLPDMAQGNADVLRLVIGCFEPYEVTLHRRCILQRNLSLLGVSHELLVRLIVRSNEWEVEEREWMWQLAALEVSLWPAELVLRFLGEVCAMQDVSTMVAFGAALENILPLLTVTPDLVQQVLHLPNGLQQTLTSIILFWCAKGGCTHIVSALEKARTSLHNGIGMPNTNIVTQNVKAIRTSLLDSRRDRSIRTETNTKHLAIEISNYLHMLGDTKG